MGNPTTICSKQLRFVYLLIGILYLGLFCNFLLLFYVSQNIILKWPSFLSTSSLCSSQFSILHFCQSLLPQINFNKRFKRDSPNIEDYQFSSSINYDRKWTDEDNLLKLKLAFDRTRLQNTKDLILNDDNMESNEKLYAATKFKTKPVSKRNNTSITISKYSASKEKLFSKQKRFQNHEEKSVEFFPDPQTASTSTTGKAHVWLNSYSKIPLPVLQEYCVSVRNHCPAGIQGIKGETGPKGNKGDQGLPGLDGRDGLPGEPGLDGINGRDGRDGESGLDGKHGIPGMKGKDGRDGRDGKDGERGLPGLEGKPGQKGEPGRKGRPGLPGQKGENGLPGLIAWNLTNGQQTNLLFPVSFIDSNLNKNVLLVEGSKLILNCSAIGNPAPSYAWDRIDQNLPILFNNKWLIGGVGGEQLVFNPIKREHNGLYKCSANNGLPRPIERIFNVEVLYAPQIYIKSINLSELNFELESNPSATIELVFISNSKNEIINKKIDTFKLSIQKINTFKSNCVIEFSELSEQEMGNYMIVARNSINFTQGEFKLSNTTNFGVPRIFGLPLYQDDCVCSSDLNEPENYTIASLMRFNQKKTLRRNDECVLNSKLMQLTRIGIPIYFGESKYEWGSWMMDNFVNKSFSEAISKSNKMNNFAINHRIYLAIEDEKKKLYEFTDKQQFKNQNKSTVHELTYAFTGNSQLIYNNYFLFQKENTYKILKYGLFNHDVQCFDLLANFFNYEPEFKLFSSQHNQIHLLADENGIWAMLSYDLTINSKKREKNSKKFKYSKNFFETKETKANLDIKQELADNTLIIKFEHLNSPEDELKIEKVILLKNIDNTKYGSMFIICGVLYGLDSVHKSQSRISFAYDLYEERFLVGFTSILFTNPFQNNNFLTYNALHKKIYGWDHTTLIEYPLLLETIS